VLARVVKPLASSPRPDARVMTNTRAAAAFLIRQESLHSPAAQRLIAELNAELTALYPEPGATHFRLAPDEVAAGQGAFLVGYWSDEPVACGAIRCLSAEIAEVKRMYTVPRARGQRISGLILSALEDAARKLGVRRLVLETGPRQLAALGLYRRTGFVPIERFGEYIESELSLCMAKDLDSGA
jgi:putative acetyltransferase